MEAIDAEKEIFNTKINAIEKAILDSDEYSKIDNGQQREIQKTILDYKKKVAG